MKIVVLDSHTLNPGDLSWAELESLGDCVFHERTPSDLIIPRSEGADVLLTNKVPLGRDTIESLPSLRYIGVTATGYNIIDVQAATERDIVVCNAPSYGSQSVAQMAIAHLLNLANGVATHAAGVANGRWSAARDWCFWDHPLVELEGKTMGIVGLGEIGTAVARLAKALGMRVIATTRTPQGDEFELVDLQTLARESDAISLHCPLTPETERMFDADLLATMKPSAFLINTGRGQLVDSQALANALNENRLAGAGFDTLEQEPPPADHPLLGAQNCFITPHIAWATRSARSRLLQKSIDNVKAYLSGQPQNVVS